MYKILFLISASCYLVACKYKLESRLYISDKGIATLLKTDTSYILLNSEVIKPMEIKEILKPSSSDMTIVSNLAPYECFKDKNRYVHQIKIKQIENKNLVLSSQDSCVEHYLTKNDSKLFESLKNYRQWDSLEISLGSKSLTLVRANLPNTHNVPLTLEEEVQLLLQSNVGLYYNGYFYLSNKTITIFDKGQIIFTGHGDLSMYVFSNLLRFSESIEEPD